MIRRKNDTDATLTTSQEVLPGGLYSPVTGAVLALVFVLLMLLTPGPLIDAIKQWMSVPVMPPAETGFPVDKVVHWLMFACCAYLCARAWLARLGRVQLIVLLLLFAAATELLQSVVPGRSGDVMDFCADTFGVLSGLWWYHRNKRH